MSGKLKKFYYNSWSELCLRWFLGMLFIYASIHKIYTPAHFAKIIYGYYLFPDASINIIAIVLPFIELVAGLAMILGIYPRSAATVINGLLLCFIVLISINLIRGQQFDCGCFSVGETGYTYTPGQLLVRDLVLFPLGLQVMFFDSRRKWCVRQTGNLFKNLFPSS